MSDERAPCSVTIETLPFSGNARLWLKDQNGRRFISGPLSDWDEAKRVAKALNDAFSACQRAGYDVGYENAAGIHGRFFGV